LTENPEIIQAQARTYLYLEKKGPFMTEAPKAWQEFSDITQSFKSSLSISGMAGLSKIDESKQGDDRFTYQAGLFLDKAPTTIPKGLKVRTTPAGKYARFVLTGGYHQLPQTYPQIFSILASHKISMRNEFCAEVYLNTPENTVEAELKTEILIPVS